jgi:hypothetical protein
VLAASPIVSGVQGGHYSGATSDGDSVSFDVTSDGNVTNVIAALAGSVISISQPFPVDGDGRWGGEVLGKAVRTRIHGQLAASEADGTLEVEVVNGETHHLVGPLAWHARRIPGLAY